MMVLLLFSCSNDEQGNSKLKICTNDELYEPWLNYNKALCDQASYAQEGRFSKEQLPARLYVLALERDKVLLRCGCYQVHFNSMDWSEFVRSNSDPSVMFTLINRFKELAGDSLLQDKRELLDVQSFLMRYADQVNLNVYFLLRDSKDEDSMLDIMPIELMVQQKSEAYK